jgi:hypothetical protein
LLFQENIDVENRKTVAIVNLNHRVGFPKVLSKPFDLDVLLDENLVQAQELLLVYLGLIFNALFPSKTLLLELIFFISQRRDIVGCRRTKVSIHMGESGICSNDEEQCGNKNHDYDAGQHGDPFR